MIHKLALPWFAVEHAPVIPDLMTFAKGVNSYVPLGGVAISEPPLTISTDEAHEGLDILDQALADVRASNQTA